MYQKNLPFSQVLLLFQNMLKIIYRRIQAAGSLQLIFLCILHPSLQQSMYLGFPQAEDPCCSGAFFLVNQFCMGV